MTGFQRLSLLTCAVIFGLIVLGGVVRATDSGLGCPDWPLCNGSFLPQWEKHTLIEYSHRLTASVAGLLVLGIVVAAWRSYRRVPAILYPALAAFCLLIFQAGLGGAAVLNELPPEIVTIHLGTASAILALLALVTTAAFALPRPRVGRAFGQTALLALTLTFALMLVGSYVAGAGYGLACNGWPLCNGDLIPETSAASVQLHFFHRVLAAVVGVVLVALVWLGWRDRVRAPFAAATAALALGLFGVQALIGAANIWTQLADVVSAAHLAFATLLWSILVFLNIRLHALHELRPLAPRPPPQTDLAGAAR